MTESDFWVRIKKHSFMFKWVRIDTMTAPGFFDCYVSNYDLGSAIVELKVGTHKTCGELELRPSQKVFCQEMRKYAQNLFILRYAVREKSLLLFQVLNGNEILLDEILLKPGWSKAVKKIEEDILFCLKTQYTKFLIKRVNRANA